jgi:hypothetical protein
MSLTSEITEAEVVCGPRSLCRHSLQGATTGYTLVMGTGVRLACAEGGGGVCL